jgi:hypothetical protein
MIHPRAAGATWTPARTSPPGGRCPTSDVQRAWRDHPNRSLGGAGFRIHADVLGAGDRLAERVLYRGGLTFYGPELECH